MTGFYGLPDVNADSVTMFWATTPSGGSPVGAVPWTVPRWARLVHFVVAGGGGGGGRGFTAASGAMGGGGGGGSGSICTLLVPAFMLPGEVYVSVGSGGLGAPTAGSASVGQASSISISPNSPTSVDLSFLLRAAPGGAAANGTTTGGGQGAAAGITVLALSAVGLPSLISGQAGTAGGSSAAANNVTYGNTGVSFGSGGTGGGGTDGTTDRAGGGIAVILAGWDPIPVALAGGIAGGGAGATGYVAYPHSDMIPLYSTGGTGGGSNHAGTGGAGGNGGLVSGGGGGGGGTTGGAGGNGGDGFAIITVI